MSSATPSRCGPNRSRPPCHRRNASPPLCFTSIRHPSELSAFASTNKAYASAALSISLVASTSPSGPITRYVAIPSQRSHTFALPSGRLNKAVARGARRREWRRPAEIQLLDRRLGADQSPRRTRSTAGRAVPATKPCSNRTRPRPQQMTLWHVVKDSVSSLLRGPQIESLGKHSGGRVDRTAFATCCVSVVCCGP
jgi:hypothetical protein